MGRSPCCSKEGLNRGAWTAIEDKILTSYIKVHGEGKWRNLPKRAGLKRCGKSCRLRWLNYLRPDIKRGNISSDEGELIIRLHKLLGNRWSLIAGRLPGRTDNEIKNYWNTTLGKKSKAQSPSSPSQENATNRPKLKKPPIESVSTVRKALSTDHKVQVIRTKATRCTKALVALTNPPPIGDQIDTTNSTTSDLSELQDHHSYLIDHPYQDSNNLNVQHGAEEVQEMQGAHKSDFLNLGCNDFEASNFDAMLKRTDNKYSIGPDNGLQLFNETKTDCWTTACLEDNGSMNHESLAFLLDPEQWPLQ